MLDTEYSLVVKRAGDQPAILGEPFGGDIFGGRAQIKSIVSGKYISDFKSVLQLGTMYPIRICNILDQIYICIYGYMSFWLHQIDYVLYIYYGFPNAADEGRELSDRQ